MNELIISWKSLFRILLVLTSIFLLWNLSDILMTVLLSLMLAAALYPFVESLNKKLPYTMSAIIVTFVVFLPFVFTFFILLTTFFAQLPSLLVTLTNVIRDSTFTQDLFRQIDFTQY